MKKPWWIVLPLAWAGVVVLVAALAWWVIDGAGGSILAEPAHDAVSPAPTSAPATTETSAPRPSRTPSRTPRPTPDPTTGSTGADPTTQPPASSAPPTTEPPPTTTQQPDQVERTSTWQGEAGLLRVSCTGPTLRLDGASPHDGFVVDKAEREGGREIEVKFRSTDGEREVEIHVVCVNGVPDFTVEESGSDD